ncbi:hypothetical protein GGR42_000462 [Saonia flava]|uniref:Uncharacterized protein n=1 Tax=Saonia flava TaxID=523696 RepID=A0A846QSR4_9FLAO|nr:hypothetical protein [Saonia flava]NJB70000.1 hypothetical protein [Saonia flava]
MYSRKKQTIEIEQLVSGQNMTHENHFDAFLQEINHVLPSLDIAAPNDPKDVIIFRELFLDYKRNRGLLHLLQ